MTATPLDTYSSTTFGSGTCFWISADNLSAWHIHRIDLFCLFLHSRNFYYLMELLYLNLYAWIRCLAIQFFCVMHMGTISLRFFNVTDKIAKLKMTAKFSCCSASWASPSYCWKYHWILTNTLLVWIKLHWDPFWHLK